MRFPFQCENIRFRNLNIFENFEHVYRRHPFDVLLPVREKYFLSPHFITINTTQFPLRKIYVDRQKHTLYGVCERKRAENTLSYSTWLIDSNDDQSYEYELCQCEKICMSWIRLNRPTLLGNLVSILLCSYETRCNSSKCIQIFRNENRNTGFRTNWWRRPVFEK